MTREIKFRVWDKHDKKYIKNHPLLLDEDGRLFEDDEFVYDKDLIDIEQFTGLKDSKGQEIYEGDVVKSSDFPYSAYGNGKIFFENGAFLVSFKSPFDYLNICRTDDLIIVGNIHEPLPESPADWVARHATK